MKRRPHTALIGLATVAAVVGLGAPPASATPVIPYCPLSTSCGTVFYSDSQHTSITGFRGRDCSGAIEVYGVTWSAYSAFVTTPCGVVGNAGGQ